MLSDNLKKLSFWSKFIGICFLISGIISGILGIFAYIIGAIPGIITAFIGWKLCKAAKDARLFAYSINEAELDRQLLSDMVEKYTSFFRILGIYMIVGFIFFVIFLILAVALGAFFYHNYTNEFSNFSILMNYIK